MAEYTPLFRIVGGATPDTGESVDPQLEIRIRRSHQAAIAELGQAALTGVGIGILLGQACALVENAIDVGFCAIIEHLDEDDEWVVRNRAGSVRGESKPADLAADADSLLVLTHVAEGAIRFEDLENEERFRPDLLVARHAARSGIAVRIPGDPSPWGVILACSPAPRSFRDFEVDFLHAVANLLGEAILQERTSRALVRSQRHLRHLIDSSPDAIVTVDAAGTVLDWNPQAANLFGLAASEVLGRPFPRGTVSDRRYDLLQKAKASFYRTGRSRLVNRTLEGEIARGDETIPVEVRIVPLDTEAGPSFTCFVRDIRERKLADQKLQQSEQHFKALVENSSDAIALLDNRLCFDYLSPSTRRVLGFDETELLGTDILDLVQEEDRGVAAEFFLNSLENPESDVESEFRLRHKRGNFRWIEVTARNLLDDPSMAAIVLNYRDITERKDTSWKLEFQAYHDSMTGLPNRLLFRDRLARALVHSRRSRRGIAVLYIDLDHFKEINDTLGHSIGDELLKEAANRMLSAIRADDTVCRLGGDEFCILLLDVDDESAAMLVGEKIISSLTEPYDLAGQPLSVTASVGVALSDEETTDGDDLLKSADAAMYEAKQGGRNGVRLYSPSMRDRQMSRLLMERKLLQALERKEFELHYQPVIDGRTGEIAACEALLRWNHPQRGLIAASEFLAIAEETNILIPLGRWIIREACSFVTSLSPSRPGFRLAINVSASQLREEGFVRMFGDEVAECGVDPARIEVEINESVAADNIDETRNVVRELRAKGFRIAIDDFGVGRSSLLYLKSLPVHNVKIDRQFIDGIDRDASDEAIVSSIIHLAHSLGLVVTAEGVETEEQKAILDQYGCDAIQGYVVSRPLPRGEATAFLAGRAAGAR